MQSDNATNFTAEIAQELMNVGPLSTLLNQEEKEKIEYSSICSDSIHRALCNIGTSTEKWQLQTNSMCCKSQRCAAVADVLRDGRLYVLDTGQKVHFERLKKHVPARWDWAAHQPYVSDHNVAIIADPYVEESHEEKASDISR